MRPQDRDFPEPAVTTFSFLENFVSADCPANKMTTIQSNFRFSSSCMGRFRTCFELCSAVIGVSTAFSGLDYLQKLFFKVNLRCSNTKVLFRGSFRCNLSRLFGSGLIAVDRLLYLNYQD